MEEAASVFTERHLTLKEARAELGVSERTIHRWIKSGKLKSYKPGRDHRIPESAIREVIEESEVYPKAEAPPSQDRLFKNGSEERGVNPAIRESKHIKDYVHGCLERWGRVTRGEDPHLAPDHAYAIEVSQNVIALTEWFGKLLRAVKAELPPEVAVSEQREIVELIDRMGAAAAEIGAIANAAEGITAEAVDEEFQALIDAEVKAVVAKQRPADVLAQLRADKTLRRFIGLSELQRRAAEVKKLAAGA
jgi:excisionase family DNA binding protein